MPPVTPISPATGLPTSEHYIHTTSARFVDSHGRSLLLRGVNLSGSTKAPPNCQSQLLEGFWESAEAGGETFVNQPLNLDDGTADVHLSRLRGWGFNMLRYVVTWEALEHGGPGVYDYEFMDYTVRVLQKCKEFGFKIYMDPHQDLWSRFSGGSGAPYWTLVACGLQPRNFTGTQASLIHAEYPCVEKPEPETFPAMIWSTNYYRLATQTIFTLFFAGRDFAPKCIIDGVNIQDYLNNHFVAAFGLLADRIRDAGGLLDECVIGWDSMNEPSEGYLGHENLNDFSAEQAMKKGSRPTPAQSFRLGMGTAQTMETWSFGAMGPKREGTVTVDPKGLRAWLDPSEEPNGVSKRWGWKRDPGWQLGTCVWALHDVWDPESGYMLIPDYFQSPPFDPTRHVDFVSDYWRPHWRKYSQRLRQSHPECIHFIQPPVFVVPPQLDEDDTRGRCCYTPHYYDGLTLVTRHWNWFNADALGLLRGKYATVVQALRIGEWAIRKSLQDQLSMFLQDAKERLGEYPTLIGEIGTPFDMDNKRSYGYTDDGKHFGDYTQQQKALDASLNAADGTNGMNWTVWTYCPDNSHEWGDGWNLEDLSLWSADDLTIRSSYRMEEKGTDAETINHRSSAQLLRRSGLSNASLPTNAATPTPSEMVLPELRFSNNFGNPSSSTVSTFADADSQRVAAAGYALRSLAATPGLDPIIMNPGAATSVQSVRSGMFESGADADNLYDFLTNGARAVGAFVRPWPIAVVGVPKDIKFDLAKADFKLTVTVKLEDIPVGHSLSGLRAEGADEKETPMPTEIFVPLVHYAMDPYAPAFTNGASLVPASSSTSYRTSSSQTASPASTISHLPSNPDIDSPSRSTTLTTRINGDNGAWRNWQARDVPLALDIEASPGSRWEVDGQVLKWWYPVPGFGGPLRPSSLGSDTSEDEMMKEKEGESVERWIRIRRRGGPILGIGGPEIRLREEDEQCGSMWDQLCSKWC